MAELAGRFHAHLTVSGDNLNALAQVCAHLRIKRTIIDLSRDQRSQRDVMTTAYFADDQPGAVSRIIDLLEVQSRVLADGGFQIVRAKLEHETLPSLSSYSEEQYHEVHCKLRLPAPDFEARRSALQAVVEPIGMVLSRNPYERSEEAVIQFANGRIKKGDVAGADAIVAAWEAAIDEGEFERVETKRETVVFDTHVAHDAWWA